MIRAPLSALETGQAGDNVITRSRSLFQPDVDLTKKRSVVLCSNATHNKSIVKEHPAHPQFCAQHLTRSQSQVAHVTVDVTSFGIRCRDNLCRHIFHRLHSECSFTGSDVISCLS